MKKWLKVCVICSWALAIGSTVNAETVYLKSGEKVTGKRKRTGDKWVLELVENPDILNEIGRKKGDRILVGFAVESASPRRGALKKLKAKNLDFIVLNSPSAFGADVTSVDIIDDRERTIRLRKVSKHEVAENIVRMVEDLARKRASGRSRG